MLTHSDTQIPNYGALGAKKPLLCENGKCIRVFAFLRDENDMMEVFD